MRAEKVKGERRGGEGEGEGEEKAKKGEEFKGQVGNGAKGKFIKG